MESSAGFKRLQRLQRHVCGAAPASTGRSGPAVVARGVTAGPGRPVKTTATIKEERDRATFNVREMTYALDGGEEMTRMKERASRQLEASPIFHPSRGKHDLTRQEVRKLTLERVRALWKMFYADGGNLQMREARLEVAGLVDPSWYTRNGVHFGLFVGSIVSQGTQDQQDDWVVRCMMLEIYGCMAMTELGHGSFLRGLETTATYIPETQEFDLHSPTVTATKWWIGAAGQTATHSAVYARLIVGGEDKGVHVFLVQLRDLETHSVMRGISVGDCGAKMGRDGIDNGWIRFDHVRIPRDQMLMKHAQVSAEGVYTKPPRAELAYGALLSGRSSMVKDSADWLKLATTITIRYAAIRRQGEPFVAGGPEPQIIDYSTLQSRLIPILATTYAFVFTGRYMSDLQKKLEDSLENNDTSILADVHATSAGLKSYCTWYTLHSIETLRHACGGHGYSKYTGLSSLYADFAVQCTWEGDNYVMALQTARYLITCLRKVEAGTPVSGSVKYLTQAFPKAWPVSTAADLRDTNKQLLALQHMAASLVRAAGAQLADSTAKGMNKAQAWNSAGVALFKASRVHCAYNVAMNFVEATVATMKREKASGSSAHVGVTLKRVCDLYCLHYLSENLTPLLMSGFVTPAQAKLLQAEVGAAIRDVRSIAVPLVDAFNLSDFVINSPFGRRDGDVYPKYFDMVKAAPGAVGVAPYFKSTIKPMLDGEDMAAMVSKWEAEQDEEDGDDE